MFRLGIIYKQQGKFEDSLACFDRILRNPPSPLAHADIWFQIGHVFEQQKNVSRLPCQCLPLFIFIVCQHRRARDAYERVVEANPQHAKVLQQLGWLYHQDGSSFQNHDIAIQYFTKSLEAGTYFFLVGTKSSPILIMVCCRSDRCSELVSSWPCLYGWSKVQQGLRGLPTSRLPRRSQSYLLVLHRRTLLPDQPIPRRPRCLFTRYTHQSIYLRSLV